MRKLLPSLRIQKANTSRSRYLSSFVAAGAALSLCMAAIFPARSALIVYDGFSYPEGELASNNGGTGWGGAWTGGGTAVPAALDYPNLASEEGFLRTTGLNNGAFRSLSTPLSTGAGEIWGSYLFQAEGSLNNYTGFSLYNGDTELLFIGQRFSQTDFGIEVSGGGDGANTPFAVDNSVHLLVFSLTLSGGGGFDASLWIDPVTGIAAPTTGPDAAVAGTQNFDFDTIRLQSGEALADYNFDEIRFGTAYRDVAPFEIATPIVVPEVATGLFYPAGFVILCCARLGSRSRKRDSQLITAD
ncbi:MAG: hypothetical protein H7145_21620 [Akkermansiaceae bacterium]|nr:hypothetical protein [Armatimonadota bacterium]